MLNDVSAQGDAMDAQAAAIAIGVAIISIVLVLVGVLFMAIVVPKWVFRYIQGPLEQRIAARYRSDEILLQDLRANSFGQESTGRFRLRGNGALVLTDDVLHFFLFIPRLDVAIPLEAITEVTMTQSHLGKTMFYPLLKVTWFSNGMSDSIAWYVTDAHALKSRIDIRKAGRATNETFPDATK